MSQVWKIDLSETQNACGHVHKNERNLKYLVYSVVLGAEIIS